MFEELSDRIRQEEGPPPPLARQILQWALVSAIAVVLFGGLYYVIQHME